MKIVFVFALWAMSLGVGFINPVSLSPGRATTLDSLGACQGISVIGRKAYLDSALLNTIEDDACIQGTRPEYVQYGGKWYVATADYGNKTNQVRLYDPERLRTAKKTSEPGVVVHRFSCSPWVQNLHWIPQKNVLVLVQNQIEGRRWRFTFLDLNRSLESGTEHVIRVVDTDKPDELEGFALTGDLRHGIAVTSSRTNNVHFMKLTW